MLKDPADRSRAHRPRRLLIDALVAFAVHAVLIALALLTLHWIGPPVLLLYLVAAPAFTWHLRKSTVVTVLSGLVAFAVVALAPFVAIAFAMNHF